MKTRIRLQFGIWVAKRFLKILSWAIDFCLESKPFLPAQELKQPIVDLIGTYRHVKEKIEDAERRLALMRS
jgi:hypothetical protein